MILTTCKYFDLVGNRCSRVTDGKCSDLQDCEFKYIAELKAENDSLYEEKDCLHKIIDRLLENAGYSKDIASAEDFEDVYENMQYNKQKLLELQQTLQEIKELINTCMEFRACKRCKFFKMCDKDLEGCILNLITKAEEE